MPSHPELMLCPLKSQWPKAGYSTSLGEILKKDDPLRTHIPQTPPLRRAEGASQGGIQAAGGVRYLPQGVRRELSG